MIRRVTLCLLLALLVVVPLARSQQGTNEDSDEYDTYDYDYELEFEDVSVGQSGLDNEDYDLLEGEDSEYIEPISDYEEDYEALAPSEEVFNGEEEPVDVEEMVSETPNLTDDVEVDVEETEPVAEAPEVEEAIAPVIEPAPIVVAQAPAPEVPTTTSTPAAPAALSDGFKASAMVVATAAAGLAFLV